MQSGFGDIAASRHVAVLARLRGREPKRVPVSSSPERGVGRGLPVRPGHVHVHARGPEAAGLPLLGRERHIHRYVCLGVYRHGVCLEKGLYVCHCRALRSTVHGRTLADRGALLGCAQQGHTLHLHGLRGGPHVRHHARLSRENPMSKRLRYGVVYLRTRFNCLRIRFLL
jgi:hypothetical protein